MNVSLSNIVSASDIQKNYRRVFDRAKKTKQPVIVLRGNKAEVAVIDIDTLEELQIKAADAEYQEALKAIKISEDENKSGKLKVLKPGSLADISK